MIKTTETAIKRFSPFSCYQLSNSYFATMNNDGGSVYYSADKYKSGGGFALQVSATQRTVGVVADGGMGWWLVVAL